MITVIIAILAVLIVAAVLGVLSLSVLASGGPRASRRFSVTPVAATELRQYLDRKASFAVTATLESEQAPERMWNALLRDGAFSWVPFLTGPIYADTSRTIGSRRALLGTVVAIGEKIVMAEPARRLALTATGLSLPLSLKSFAQQYELAPTTDGGSRITWTVACTPRFFGFLPLRLTAPLVRPFLDFGLKGLDKRA